VKLEPGKVYLTRAAKTPYLVIAIVGCKTTIAVDLDGEVETWSHSDGSFFADRKESSMDLVMAGGRDDQDLIFTSVETL
jgi:hypothetical protein